MVKTFLNERRSWILFFLFQQLLFLFIAYIDSTIPFKSVLYIIFLCMIMFILFLFIRYNKETRFYKSLEDWENNLDLTSMNESDSPFEAIIEKRMTLQTEQLKDIVSQNRMLVEHEKDELLSWIHEVKTPLTAMHLMIERLDDHLLKSQITYEWLRIHLLLDQQLHQKRISFIENDLYLETLQIKSIVSKEIKTLQSWCIQKGIGFDIQLEVTEVLSDAKWLAFIIRQLLSNAIKYSDSGDIIIKSYVQDDQTILEIQDFGRGINPKDLPRIFDKGFTSTTNHDDNTSTGMGLFIKKSSKAIINNHERSLHYG